MAIILLDNTDKDELQQQIAVIDKKGGVYVGSGEMPEGYNIQIDPEGDAVEDWNSILESLQISPGFANSIEECVDTSKVYVLPDGFIYGYISTEIVKDAYTNLAEPLPDNTSDTAKWVNGYRITSTGVSAQSGTTLSNPINVKKGDVIRIKGVDFRANTDRYHLYCLDPSGTTQNNRDYISNLKEENGTVVNYSLKEDVHEFTIVFANLAKDGTFRVAFPTPSEASSIIITKNEEIVESSGTVKEYSWKNTGRAFVTVNYEDQIIALENNVAKLTETDKTLQKNIEKLEAEIKNTETVEATDIPDYWKDHIAEKIARIKNLHRQYGKDCFSFVLMADTHYPSNLGKKSPLLAKKIMEETDIKYAIHVGDWQTRGCYNTKEELLAENEKIEEMFKPLKGKLLMQQGNHDGSYGYYDKDDNGELSNYNADGTTKNASQRETYVHNLTPQELHEFIYRKVGMVGDVHFDETGTAYYIDDVSNNVRYIGLNTQCNGYELQEDGTQLYPKMWLMNFTQSQFDFIINEALVEGVTDKTNIVVFGHVPLWQEIGDRDVMSGVLNAYKNKTTYTGTYTDVNIETNYAYQVSVNVDFTEAKGKFVAYFCGHIHYDHYTTDKGFPIITTRCDAKEENTENLKVERIAETVTEQSFDVFTITPKTIYTTKIGAGSNREINY